jgi:hypothetical protein
MQVEKYIRSIRLLRRFVDMQLLDPVWLEIFPAERAGTWV